MMNELLALRSHELMYRITHSERILSLVGCVILVLDGAKHGLTIVYSVPSRAERTVSTM